MFSISSSKNHHLLVLFSQPVDFSIDQAWNPCVVSPVPLGSPSASSPSFSRLWWRKPSSRGTQSNRWSAWRGWEVKIKFPPFITATATTTSCFLLDRIVKKNGKRIVLDRETGWYGTTIWVPVGTLPTYGAGMRASFTKVPQCNLTHPRSALTSLITSALPK